MRANVGHRAFSDLLAALADALDADRCTLRLAPDFAVVAESRRPDAPSLMSVPGVSLKGQPVVEALHAGEEQVVQADCQEASDDPAFRRMLAVFGGMTAQVVTAVRRDGELVGIVSVHLLGETRDWSDEDLQHARETSAEIAALLG